MTITLADAASGGAGGRGPGAAQSGAGGRGPGAGSPASTSLTRFVASPAFPLDAVVRSVTINGRRATFTTTQRGDIQQAQIIVESPSSRTTIAITYTEGADVYTELAPPAPGADNAGLRILRSTAAKDHLRLVLEGRGGRSYPLFVRTPRRIGQVPGVTLKPGRGEDMQAEVAFEGASDRYVRREIVLPLTRQ
jgi:hypothetical protein